MRKTPMIAFMFFLTFLIHAENIIINTKSIYINEVAIFPSINEYLNSYKRFKNYRITDNKTKKDIALEIRIRRITFTVTNFDNDPGSVAIEDGGVVLQKKNEQTVKFNYEIELILSHEKNVAVKKIDFNDSFNVWFSFKKITPDEDNQMMEHDIYESKTGVKYSPEDINKAFNKNGLMQYKEQLLTDMSKKIANKLAVEL
jgi:hypothetical protein